MKEINALYFFINYYFIYFTCPNLIKQICHLCNQKYYPLKLDHTHSKFELLNKFLFNKCTIYSLNNKLMELKDIRLSKNILILINTSNLTKLTKKLLNLLPKLIQNFKNYHIWILLSNPQIKTLDLANTKSQTKSFSHLIPKIKRKYHLLQIGIFFAKRVTYFAEI